MAVTLFLFACNNSATDESRTDTDTSQKLPRDTSITTGDSGNMPMKAHAQAVLSGTNADTAVSGTVDFDTTAGGKVKMVLNITVAKKAGSSVAVHIHEHGDCGNKGEMAHGHWNPDSKQHGQWGNDSHAGDLGNIKLDKEGKGTLTIETDRWQIGGSQPSSILNKAIIVHSGMDDYKTQPTGNSGSRIGCGVIQ